RSVRRESFSQRSTWRNDTDKPIRDARREGRAEGLEGVARDVANPTNVGEPRVDENHPEHAATAFWLDRLDTHFDRRQNHPQVLLKRDERTNLRGERLRQSRIDAQRR